MVLGTWEALKYSTRCIFKFNRLNLNFSLSVNNYYLQGDSKSIKKCPVETTLASSIRCRIRKLSSQPDAVLCLHVTFPLCSKLM